MSRESCACTRLYASDRKPWHPPGLAVAMRHQPGCELDRVVWVVPQQKTALTEKELRASRPKRTKKEKRVIVSLDLFKGST